MKKKIVWRVILIAAVVIASVIFFLPNTPAFKYMPSWWQDNMPAKGISLGLDLQGGIHLVYEVEGDKAAQSSTQRIADAIKSELAQKGLKDTVTVSGLDIQLVPGSLDARKMVQDSYPDLAVREGAGMVSYGLSPKAIADIKNNAVAQALEVIRNRVDQFGVAEPSIQKQGQDELVVELPGIKDPARAIQIIGKTARLEFKVVDDESPVAAQLPGSIIPGGESQVVSQFAGKIPADDEILFGKVTNPDTGAVTETPYLLKKLTLLTGEYLTEARVAIDPRFNEPYVELKFNPEGAKLFDQITAANVKKRLAIILDNNVYSAPVIRERISGGSAQISGNFSMDEAKDLSIVLKAGALKAPLKMLQNVTVGPSLGRDSIRDGERAGIVALIVVLGFMVFYYKVAGLIADFAVILNLLLLMGAMASLNATLSLPGMAGVILAIGMAVDSNVLMFERMREELRLGKTPKAAVESGYNKAFWTIFDSHVTTLITSAVLFQFGTGPIKGFAVTLSLGVAINLFTALIGTKTIFDLMHLKKEVRKLSI
ncbi:MAG: protein translocase subunit SecD [Nitrospiraceae bacterium]|nr:protein translocase subunit SecD [Nitrospiraceae bacterium]